MKKIYKFKSREPFYSKERAGIKPNTVREINLNEDKFLELIQHTMNGFNPGDIEIEILETIEGFIGGTGRFVRDIEDISIYTNLMIISWKHSEYPDE